MPQISRRDVLGKSAGRKFRAFLRYRTGTSVEELRLLPIQPREVVIRTEASGVCYTIVGQSLGTRDAPRPSIPNHSGFGVVEEIGPQVKRVQVGDRVIIPGTPQCGQCYECLQGRSDWCQFLATNPAHPMAVMPDGTPVFEGGALGGLSELMVVSEEYCCPVFTDLPAEQLTMLGDTVGTGLAAGMNLARVEPGSDCVVLGAGPVGLGAIQSARIMGAAQIIVVEPIKVRRDLALKLGATMVMDPNVEGKGLVEKIRELCKGKTDRRFAGGRAWGNDLFAVPRGPDFTIEAVGGDTFPAQDGSRPRSNGRAPVAAGVGIHTRRRPHRHAWFRTKGRRVVSGDDVCQSRAHGSLGPAGRIEHAARFASLCDAGRERAYRFEIDRYRYLSARSHARSDPSRR